MVRSQRALVREVDLSFLSRLLYHSLCRFDLSNFLRSMSQEWC